MILPAEYRRAGRVSYGALPNDNRNDWVRLVLRVSGWMVEKLLMLDGKVIGPYSSC